MKHALDITTPTTTRDAVGPPDHAARGEASIAAATCPRALGYNGKKA
eukprot:CAMPEP_0206061946 /NCGR_PEP_ID=MMETSP1466-20131121/55623_1 /ASSEMBLY_ACC=CAM_ASM_001126 /TAXON_ID=44452 /ORGANISM="Pavlova gyrans, Strain CCMP608" /LENGTH=46 /DNA_ID= /DNA_START= /DNA_END= /DNA_ORIENTATION=